MDASLTFTALSLLPALPLHSFHQSAPEWTKSKWHVWLRRRRSLIMRRLGCVPREESAGRIWRTECFCR